MLGVAADASEEIALEGDVEVEAEVEEDSLSREYNEIEIIADLPIPSPSPYLDPPTGLHSAVGSVLSPSLHLALMTTPNPRHHQNQFPRDLD